MSARIELILSVCIAVVTGMVDIAGQLGICGHLLNTVESAVYARGFS
jgi:hypothetical protein